MHRYTAAGNLAVTLRVTNPFGCTRSLTKAGAIQIVPGISTSFSVNNPGTCAAPALVQFTNSTTGPGPLVYHWRFGDGSTSHAVHPTHTYSQNGDYSVSLIATSPQGCVDTLKKEALVKIGAAKAGFNHPSGACVDEKTSFINTTTPVPLRVEWDFGDGTSSTQSSPSKTYTRAGKYTVRLISHFGSCSDTIRKLVPVTAKPTADFTAGRQSACRLPVTVPFQSLATGSGNSFHWDFGDSTTASTAAPLHTYTKEGTYTVRLIVTNSGGCSDTITKKEFISVRKPDLQLSGARKNGCVSNSIQPTAAYTTGETISSYRWNFGDGATSEAAAPEHLYTQPGTYTVTLIVTTTEGCTDTVSVPGAVRLGAKPTAAFELQPRITCPFENILFTDKSTGKVDQWFWNFGDGGTSAQPGPVYQYSDTGWQKVTLVVYNNTCPDTVVVENAVYVNPPVSVFMFTNTCTDKYTKQFTDKSLGSKTWFWEFGDGETSTEQHPLHTFRRSGWYNVKLTVTNGNCTHFSVWTVAVIDEKAEFTTPDTIICRNSPAQFKAEGITASNIENWLWEYGDGTTSNEMAKDRYTYPNAGTYQVALTITDLLGCKSTKKQTFTVFGPRAGFTPSVKATCLSGNKVNFQDASTTDGSHPLVKWAWDYGDNVFDSLAGLPSQHSYSAAGTYTVKLTVTDAFGCSDSATSATPVVIAQPRAAFTVSDTAICTGKTIRFSNASQGENPVYSWSFGNGGVSAQNNPAYAYAATGLYSVKLVMTDRYGCKDSVTKEDLISISFPKAAFLVSDSFGTCPPLLVNFSNRSSNFSSIAWDFDDGNFSKLDTPSHFYAVPGVFMAKLVATGPGGCTDTARQKIVVKGPSGTFSYEPLNGCSPLTVAFKASTRNSASFIWDFSDGSTRTSLADSTTHTYAVAGEFVPRMILTDAGGCSVPVQGKDTIRVFGVTTDIDLNKSTFCDNGPVQFTSRTVSNDLITGHFWSFGDGALSTASNPYHHFQQPGTYTVALVATTQHGCSIKKQFTDTVKVYQSPLIEIVGDSAACAPAAFTFSGKVIRGEAAQLRWTWNLGNGETATGQNPAAQHYSSDGDFTITTVATNQHGCSDTAVRKAVVYSLPTTTAGASHWICRGSLTQLKATGADRYQWQPVSSLSCTECDSPLAAPTDITQYTVTGYNRFGCSRTDSITVRVHQPFTLKVEKGDTVCAGQAVMLTASGAGEYTWLPSTGVKNPSAASSPATPGVSTQYTVIAKDTAGCFTDSGRVYIKVWPIPTIETETAKTLAVGNTLTLKPKYSADVSRYEWSNRQTLSCAACPSPVASPKTETNYTIEVKNDGGCVAKESIIVKVICNGGNLFIPNTFSPNDDGTNDRFYPRGTGISSIKSLKVFNRWGEMVFSRKNFNANDAAAGWDGKLKGTGLSPDVFVYTCEVVCLNNEVLLYRGDVTLLR